MAAVNECFSLGSTVACKTCFNQEIEGEVLAFDPQTKMLILKRPASNNRPSLNDVHIINLALVSEVQVTKEVNNIPQVPLSLNLHKLNIRVRNQIEEKRRLVKALAAGVSPEGQKLFLAISKTIMDITWQGPNIVVWNSVIITPPYKLDNVKGTSEKAVSHIRKVVEKYIKDQVMSESSSTVSLSSETSPVQL
uniref:AD domain-containing protein n=1 Tax=Carausius morosus TaxID=7022 RepID=A0A481SVK8_CARMO|nr:hypothetical protein [Carausius morosus]